MAFGQVGRARNTVTAGPSKLVETYRPECPSRGENSSAASDHANHRVFEREGVARQIPQDLQKSATAESGSLLYIIRLFLKDLGSVANSVSLFRHWHRLCLFLHSLSRLTPLSSGRLTSLRTGPLATHLIGLVGMIL
jgi:hypothetical protein